MNDNIDISQLNSTLQDIQRLIEVLLIEGQAKPVYDTSEAAVYLGMSEEWLKRARKTGSLSGGCEAPAFICIGRLVKYRKVDLDQYLNGRPKFEHLAQKKAQL